jgi:hypothetical protein
VATEEYDPETNTWDGGLAPPTPLPQPRVAPATAVAGSRLYVFGGQQGANPTNTVYQYDPFSGQWTEMTPMPTPRYGASAVTAGNGKIYVVGGIGPTGFCPDLYCPTVEEYTPPTGTGGGGWKAAGNGISQLPSPRGFAGLALGQNGRLYVAGGSRLSGALLETYEYDPANPGTAWQPMADLHQGRAGLGLAPAGDGKLYAVGGLLSGAGMTTVERFVLPTPGAPKGSWEGPSGLAGLPAARGLLGMVGLPNGRLLVAGGTDTGNGTTAFADTYEYDPATNGWAPLTPLPTARFELGLGLLPRGQLLTVGGRVGGTDLTTVESSIHDILPAVSAGGPYTALAGNPAQLSATGSDADGDSLSFAWDLDGTLFYATPGQSVTMSTAGLPGGNRAVRVRARDPLGGYAVASTTLTIIAPARVAFATQPGIAPAGARLSPQPVVRVEAADGTLISDFNGPVTLAFGTNAGGGILGGTPTVNAVNGVATFTDLFVTAPGSGYTLVASSGSLQTAASAPFTVTPAPSLCSPRPNVAVATTRAGAGRLQATLTAQTLPATPNNSLQRIVVTRMANATASLNGSPVTPGASVPFQAGTTQATLLLQRQNSAASATVAFTVADGCGDWKSFVGGGPGAF